MAANGGFEIPVALDMSQALKGLNSFESQVDRTAAVVSNGFKINLDSSSAGKAFKSLSEEVDAGKKAIDDLLDVQQKALAGMILTGQKGSAEYSSLQAEIKKTAAAVGDYEAALQEAHGASQKLPNPLEGFAVGEALAGLGEFASSIGEAGVEGRDSLQKMRAQTGLVGEDFERLKDQADDAFVKGVGGSVAEARMAMASAQKQLGSFFDGDNLAAFTAKAAGISEVFGPEIDEVLGKSRTLVSSFADIGGDGEKAGNLIALAMQKAGTGADDVLDTLDEYSALAAQMGYSSEQWTGLLIEGAQAGARDLDKVADSAKEAQIRLRAGDTAKALKDIAGPVSSAIQGIVKAGESGQLSVQQVMQQSAQAIESAFDAGQISESMRSQLQVAIAGTPAEDLGSELYGRIFAAEIDTEAIRQQAEQAGTEVTNALGPVTFAETIGKELELLASQASEAVAPITAGLGGILTTASQVGPGLTLISQQVTALGGVSGVFASIKGGIGTMVTAVQSAGKAMLTFLMSPAGLAIAALVALVAVVKLTSKSHKDLLQDQLDAGNAQLKFIETQKKGIQAQIDQNKEMPKLAKNYEDLASKTNRTAAEEKKLGEIKLNLNKQYPGLIKNGQSYGESLKAVQAQATQSKVAIGGLMNQMLQLDVQAAQIAARNRKIQAEILQDSIVTGLFSAQNNFVENAAEGVLNFFGTESSGLAEFRKNIQDVFTNLINAKDANTLQARINDFAMGLQKWEQQGRLTKQEYVAMSGQLSQMGDLLMNQFKATEAATDAASRHGAVISDTGEAAVTAAEMASDAEALRTRRMQEENARRAALIDDELLKQLVLLDNKKKENEREYTLTREKYVTEIREKKRKNADLEALDSLHTSQLATIEQERSLALIAARKKYGVEVLRVDADIRAQQIESLRLASESITGAELGLVRLRTDMSLSALRQGNVQKIEALVQSSTEFAERLQIEAQKEIDAEINAQLELARVRTTGTTEQIANAQKEYDRAHEARKAAAQRIQEDTLREALQNQTKLGLAIQNEITRGTAEEIKAWVAAQLDLQTAANRERIAAIPDLMEQERELRLLEVEETLRKEVEANAGNEPKILELTRAAERKKAAIIDEYRRKGNVAFAVQLAFQENFYKGFLSRIDAARQAALEKEIDDIDRQLSEAQRLRDRDEISYDEYNNRLVELTKERMDREKELGQQQFDFLRSLNQGMALSFAQLTTDFGNKLATLQSSFTGTAAEVTAILETASLQLLAITAQAAAEGENIAKASANAALDIALQVLLADQAKFLFTAFGASISDLGVIGGPLAFIGIAAALTGLAAVAKGALNNAKFEKGGLVKGGEQQITVNERGQEFVTDHRSTKTNLEYLLWQNRNKGRPVEDYIIHKYGRSIKGGSTLSPVATEATVTRAIAEQTQDLRTEIREMSSKLDEVTKTFESKQTVRVQGGKTTVKGGDIQISLEQTKITNHYLGG